MRHNCKNNHLGRTSSHRHALLMNMACSLIEHKHINTTTAKAKALKRYVEPLITKSKENTTANRRLVFSYLQNKRVVTELFTVVAPKIANRPGGYTRILHTGYRLGDAAEMCMMELVDFGVQVEVAPEAAKTEKKTRRGGKKKVEAAAE
ncbi:MAG: 50S ribosomal protein L17 [Bacteroidales bacterium]|nr:50S ribosomal protein L17 [Bacteroidales bacterium]